MLSLSSLNINLYNALMSGASGYALSLDLLSGTLDSRVTFTRGSNATLVDSTGKITYAPNNLLTYSGFQGAAIGTPGTAPNDWPFNSAGGSITSFADGVIAVSATAGRQIFGPTLTIPAGQTQVWSITIVSNPNSLPFFQLFVPVNITGFASIVYYANGVAVTHTTYIPNANDRLAVVLVNGVATSTPTFRIGVGASGVSTGSASFTRPQAEVVTYQTAHGTYNPTTASAYYGPRFDYDPVTLAAKGLLIEEQRTNIILQSQTFGTTWTYSGTLTADATAGPDGTTTADLISNTGSAAVSQSPTLALVPYTISLFVKASTASQNVVLRFAAAGGTAFSLRVNAETGVVTNSGTEAFASVGSQSYGNGWYRVWGTATPTTTDGRFQIYPNAGIGGFTGGTSGNAFIYGAQLEAGAFATSYIPTVASQVTRSADVATMTGTNFSSWFNATEGTFTFSGDSAYGSGGFVGSTPTTGAILYANSNASRTFNGTNFVGTANTYTNNTVFNTALGYSASGRAIVLNSGTVASDANLIQTPTAITLGGAFGGGYINGHIRSIAYYNSRLSDAQLQALTQPDATLSLNFISSIYEV